MPFNDGKGGQPVAIEGASRNGTSNSFPRFPRWPLEFVLCEERNAN